MKNKSPWTDWVIVAVVGFGLIGFVAYFVSIPLAKLDVCKTYYPEISRWSCMVSNYGLPPRGGR